MSSHANVWLFALWVGGAVLGLVSFAVILATRKQGVSAGQAWFQGTNIYRNLEALVTPSGARWARRSAFASCFLFAAAVTVLLVQSFGGR